MVKREAQGIVALSQVPGGEPGISRNATIECG